MRWGLQDIIVRTWDTLENIPAAGCYEESPQGGYHGRFWWFGRGDGVWLGEHRCLCGEIKVVRIKVINQWCVLYGLKL